MIHSPPTSTLFPYTTLFRSEIAISTATSGGPGGQNVNRVQTKIELRWRPAETVMRLTDRKSTRLNSSHVKISYAVFCLKKKITLQFIHARCLNFLIISALLT